MLFLNSLPSSAEGAVPVALKEWNTAFFKNSEALDSTNFSASTLPNTEVTPDGESYLLQSTRLPDLNLSQPAIHFYRIYSDFKIYLDGKVIHSHGDLGKGKGAFKGYPWYIVELPQDFQGKELKVISYSSAQRIGIRKYPTIGNSFDIIANLVKSELLNLILIGLNFSFLVIVGGAAFNGYTNRKSLALGIYSIVSTAFILSSNPLTLFFYDDSIFWGYLEIFSLFLTPLTGFWLFLTMLLEKKRDKRIVIVSMLLHTGFIVVASIWSLSGDKAIWEFYQSFSILTAITLGTLIPIFVVESFKGDSELRIVSISILLILGGGIVQTSLPIFNDRFQALGFSQLSFLMIAIFVAVGVKKYFQVFSDLTEHRLEAAEKELAHVREKERAIKSLVGGVAHEFNNPLAIIRSGIDLIPYLVGKGQITKNLEKNQERLLRAINRMVTINKNLLDFGGKEQFKQDEFKASDIFKSLKIKVAELELSSELDLDFEMEGSVADRIIYGDLERATLALLAIVKNGLEAKERSASKKPVSVQFKTIKEQVIVDVLDYGPGITAEENTDIFNPFYTSKEVGDGLGLSLFVAQHVIQSCEGKIVVYNLSNPTIFRVHFTTHRKSHRNIA